MKVIPETRWANWIKTFLFQSGNFWHVKYPL